MGGQKIGLLTRKFRQGCQMHSIRHEERFDVKIFQKKWFCFFNFISNFARKTFGFWLKTSRRVVKTAMYLSRGRFCDKFFFLWTKSFLRYFQILRKISTDALWKFFGRVVKTVFFLSRGIYLEIKSLERLFQFWVFP